MAEYIDVEKARAYVETNFKGDPVLQWLGRTMIEKLPKVEAVSVRENPVIIRGKQPVGAMSFGYACPRCANIGSDLCEKCRCEVEGGFEPKIEVEPKNQPCHMCDSAFVNEELTRDNDLSYVSLGNFFLGYRTMIRSGDGKPVEIITEQWNGQAWEEMGRYRPKFCPNCGRELVENQQFKPLDPAGFRQFYSPELVHMASSDEGVKMIKEGI